MLFYTVNEVVFNTFIFKVLKIFDKYTLNITSWCETIEKILSNFKLINGKLVLSLHDSFLKSTFVASLNKLVK